MNVKIDRKYLSAIDGLRAIAVLSIILFHIDNLWLPGGFVGVDVFFVISGFVVAYSAEKLNHNSFTDYFISFYRHRLLRIYPVLLLFTVTSVFFSVLFIPMVNQTKYIELTAAASVVGLGNIFIWLKSGDYFSTSSEYNVFTHMWSLGVEEQYYLIFPFFSYFIFFSKSNIVKKLSFFALIFLAVVSLVCCAVLSVYRPDAAFYLLPARFWELAIGFIVNGYFAHEAIVRPLDPSEHRSWLWKSIPWLGATGLISAFFLADANAFPFPWALLPAVATVALIFGAVALPSNLLIKVLSTSLLVWVGRISFSLYLWHWPVIVMMKWTIGLDTLMLKLLAAVVTLLLSVTSYYLVENPVRRAQGLKGLGAWQFFTCFCASTMLVAIIAMLGFMYKPYLTLSVTGDQETWSPFEAYAGKSCSISRHTGGFRGGQLIVLSPCKPNGRTIFVLGDSHAGAYYRLFTHLAADSGYNVVVYTLGGCKLIDLFDHGVDECEDFRRAALSAISGALKSTDVVFFPGLYTKRYRETWGDSIIPTGELAPQTFTRRDVVDIEDRLHDIIVKSPKIILEGPKPLARTGLFRCADWFNHSNSYCAVSPNAPRADLLLRSGELSKLQEAIRSDLGVEIWKPFDVLCPEIQVTCEAYRDGKPLYFDTDHLSGFGNDLLVKSFLQSLNADQSWSLRGFQDF